MTRIAVLGIHHETNTFSSILADRAAYESGGIRRGEEVRRQYEGSASSIGGFFDRVPGDDGVEIVPLMDAMVNPRGPVAADIYQEMAAEMLTALDKAGPFDGVLLFLHGAGVAIDEPSLDADLAERVRAVVGPDVPIGSVVDMHGNIEERLVRAVDILLAYQTNPHVDPAIRARTVKQHLLELVKGAPRLHGVLLPLPLIVNITAQDTSMSPMREILEFAQRSGRAHGAFDVSVLEGFPYADVTHMGMSVLVYHERPESAREVAQIVADNIWEHRDELQGESVSVEEAIAKIAAHSGERPLLVLDVGDNIGGGGPGDSTVLLGSALAAGITNLVGTIWDPEAVRALSGAEVGDQVTVVAGGKSQEQEGEPLTLSGVIVGRHEGAYEAGEIAHGGFRFFDGGPMVALRTESGICVVLTSKAVQTTTPAQLTSVGLDPSSFRAIIGKGVNAPRAGYSSVCDGVLVVDTPGVTRSSVTAFPYRHRRKPMFPFEQGFDFDASHI